MNNYKSTEEKLIFTDRIKNTYEEVLTRVKGNRDREGTETSPVDTNGKNPFVETFILRKNEPYVTTLAHAIVHSWMITPKLIFKNEAIVGITRPDYAVKEHFSWGILNAEHAQDHPDEFGLSQEEANELTRRMEPLGGHHIGKKGIEIFGERGFDRTWGDGLFTAGGYQGHTVPNYYTLLDNGLDGMMEKIDKYAAINAQDDETQNTYEAYRIIIRGMSAWLEAYADEALRLASGESDETQKKYYTDIADNCAFVAHKKPVTLYQAVQLVWTLSLWDWVDCIGRTDQYLLPYYEYSMKNGDVVSPEESITSLILKTWENGVHNITIAGVKPVDGSDASNDLTYLILQTIRTIHDTHPRVSVRIHKETPDCIMELITKIWSEGMSDPTVVSDENVIPALMRIGVPIEDARDYTMLGCQEIEIPGKSNFGCEDGSFNVAAVFEYALYAGKSPKYDFILGGEAAPAAKYLTEYESFDELYDTFAKLLSYYTEHFITLCNLGQEIRGANHAKLVKGIFTDGCLEKGIPHDCGGPIYNYGVIETAGISAVSDSLVAIKKLVFEEKKISKETLAAAMAANFEGYEKERQMLLNMAPKFGNDNDEADEMAVKVLNLFWDEIAKYKSVRGDVFTGACSLLEEGIRYGWSTSALPDGRFKGEPLGNSMGPRPGADKSGVSAMLRSVAKLPLEKGVGGTTLNVVLTQRLLSTPELRKNVAATVKDYLMNGGQMAQITTANLEDLLDAKVHPERHGNLIVRIGGFSIQFVQLNETSQDEIISRYSA
ncbi:MAG: hypothetical protein IKT70_01360 [Clostridia bacterium]|nr:hypothetical protein [Clostridia bacterium]